MKTYTKILFSHTNKNLGLTAKNDCRAKIQTIDPVRILIYNIKKTHQVIRIDMSQSLYVTYSVIYTNTNTQIAQSLIFKI